MQAVPVPTVQLMGTSSTPRLTSIPVVTNIPAQHPQHAGTLILPGGRSVSVQSVNTENTDSVQGGARLTVNTNAQNGNKELYYLSPDSTGKLQLLPMVQTKSPQVQYVSPNSEKGISRQLSHDTRALYNTAVSSNVKVSHTVNSDENVQYSNFYETPEKASRDSTENENNSTQAVQENHIPDNLGDETSNDALELSRNLDQHSSYLAAGLVSQESVIPAKIEAQKRADTSGTKTRNAPVETSSEGMAKDVTALKALANIVNYKNVSQQSSDGCQQSQAICDKENNLISAGKPHKISISLLFTYCFLWFCNSTIVRGKQLHIYDLYLWK